MAIGVTERSITIDRDVLEAAVPRSNERPSWVDHVVKYGETKFLVVDVEEAGERVRLIIEPAPHL